MREQREDGGALDQGVPRETLDGMPEPLREAHEAARHLDQTRFRLLAEVAAEGILCSSPEGIVTYANDSAASILGWESRELMQGRPSADLYHSIADREMIMGLLGRGDVLDPVDLTMCSQDGRAVQVRGTVIRVRDRNGEAVEHLGVITSTRELLEEREKLDEIRDRLRRARADLEESHRDLDEFAHVVSHDLREPIRMVGSFLELLQRRCGSEMDERATEYLGFATEGAQRLDSQLADLLAYSRVCTRGTAFDRCEGEEILALAQDRLATLISETSATVTHDPLPTLVGDRGQLVTLLGHLLGNGLKFRGGSAPRIHVHVEAAGDRHMLRVEDNGVGLDPEFRHQVFDMFTRLHTREEYPGNGAGLAICRRIVERHGGEIWIRSRRGEGTSVYLTLPAAEIHDV